MTDDRAEFEREKRQAAAHMAADEALAEKVAKGEVQFTVMQKNLADLKEAEFQNLTVRPILSKSHSVAWAVRKNSSPFLAMSSSSGPSSGYYCSNPQR